MTNVATSAIVALRDFVAPLHERLSTLEGLESLVDRYGWRGPLDEPAYEKIKETLAIITAIRELITAVDGLPDDLGEMSATEAADLTMRGLAVMGALNELVPPTIADLGEPYRRPELWESLAEHILDDLLAEYLRVHYPPLYLVLRLWGAIRYERVEPTGEHRRAYRRTQLDWDRVLRMIEDPLGTLKSAYQWSDATKPFDYAAALAVLADVLRAVRVPTRPLFPVIEAPVPFQPAADRVARLDLEGLRAIIREGVSQEGHFHRIGFDVFPAATAANAPPSGLVIRPVAEGGASMQVALGKRFVLRWDVAASIAKVFGLAFFPDRVDIIGGDAAFGAKIEIATRDDGWLYLVGSEDAAHIALSGLTLGLAIKGTTSDAEVVARLATLATASGTGCRVSIPLGESDGFVKSVASRDAIELKFAPEILWSSKDGILFNGAPKLDIRLPAHIALGPVTIDHLTVSLGTTDGTPAGIAFAVTTGISAHIGPLDIVLEGLGVAATFKRQTRESNRANADRKPSIGGVDVGFDFVPPRGFGLSVDTPLVKGGGYIERIPERHEYHGRGLALAESVRARHDAPPGFVPDGDQQRVSADPDRHGLPARRRWRARGDSSSARCGRPDGGGARRHGRRHPVPGRATEGPTRTRRSARRAVSGERGQSCVRSHRSDHVGYRGSDQDQARDRDRGPVVRARRDPRFAQRARSEARRGRRDRHPGPPDQLRWDDRFPRALHPLRRVAVPLALTRVRARRRYGVARALR